MRHWYNFSRHLAYVHLVSLFSLRAYERQNIPLDRPVLMVSNHQSYLDPMIVASPIAREIDFTPRSSLFHNRLFGAYIRSLNAFPIERGQADIAAIKGIIERLRRGHSVLMFPEGTRTSDGRITPLKAGLDLIARRAAVDTVPVVVDGAFETWPRHQPWPGAGRISVLYGEPISAAQTKAMSRQEFIDLVNQRLRRMQNELRTMTGNTPFEYSE